jgi:hypothetical protein
MQHFHIPNVNYRTPWAAPNGVDPAQIDPDGGVWAQLAWRVPIDDGSCTSYVVAHIPETARLPRPAEEGAGDGSRAPRAARSGRGTPDIAEAILHGELAVEDVRETEAMSNIEDYVAQVGQGAIADRVHEHLGRSDVLVGLLRSLYTREMRSLAEGKPLPAWRRPSSGVYEVSRILAPGEEPEPELLAPAR